MVISLNIEYSGIADEDRYISLFLVFEVMHMNENYMKQFPQLQIEFGKMKSMRRDDFINHLKSYDDEYGELIKKRENQSMVLLEQLKGNTHEFEKYMDLIYEQTIYELDALYGVAFNDAIELFVKLNFLNTNRYPSPES